MVTRGDRKVPSDFAIPRVARCCHGAAARFLVGLVEPAGLGVVGRVQGAG